MAVVHGVPKSQTLLSNFTFHFHALEKEMATYSSVLAWRIPGTRACWAAVYGVAQSQTQLKRLSSSSSSSNDPSFRFFSFSNSNLNTKFKQVLFSLGLIKKKKFGTVDSYKITPPKTLKGAAGSRPCGPSPGACLP